MLSVKIKSYIIITAITGFILSSHIMAQSATDSIFLSAMKDELNRSMNELEKKDHDKPFFISYTIADIHTIKATAKYGALISSDKNNFKDWNVRVMVGDYELNDENFIPDVLQNQDNRLVYNMPQENDYMGIRMALWSQTDMVYNSAAKLYKQKKSLIENNKVEEKLLGKADFTKTQNVKILIPSDNNTLDLSKIEYRAKEISEIFKKYPEVHSSGVSINQIRANIYFLNSENSVVVYPIGYSTINVFLSVINSKDENLQRNLSYNKLSSIDLPENQIIFNDIEYMVNDIKECQELKPYDDDYSGPVLFSGDVAVDVIESALFSNGIKLLASRKPLKRNDQYTLDLNYQKKNKTWEIGEIVIDKDISVTDYSTITEYQNERLWGTYKVDAEGVIPADSLLLIKNGILKTKYNDRTPADDVDHSNGHKRFAVRSQGVYSSLAPGILKVSSSNTMTIDELKTKLIETARDDGYEYAIFIKSATVNSSNPPAQIYKIDVETGKENRLRDASFNSINDREFKNIGGFSDQIIVKNKTFGVNRMATPDFFIMPSIGGGVPVTYITPSAILINRVDISTKNMNMPIKKPIVESPFIKN